MNAAVQLRCRAISILVRLVFHLGAWAFPYGNLVANVNPAAFSDGVLAGVLASQQFCR